MRDEPVVDARTDIPIAVAEPRRERVVVRRRRARGPRRHRPTWSVRVSRQRAIRMFMVCAGVLVLMGLGLYFGLSRQEVAPAESAAPIVIAAADRSA